MSTLITTRSPSSYQLRLAAVSCRKYPSSSIFLRMHVQKLDHSIRCSLYSRDNVTQRRTSSRISPNAVFRWSCHDNGSQMLDELSPPKKDLDEGIVGVVVAGVILVAGLSLAALSLDNPVSGTKKAMETLITHQEESLTSAEKLSSGSSIPAPSVLSPSLKTRGGKVLIPAVVDQVQGQALVAMQVLEEISQLQYELEVQRKALATARSWVEDVVKRTKAEVKVLEDARAKCENQGIKVIVDNDLHNESNTESTWIQRCFMVVVFVMFVLILVV